MSIKVGSAFPSAICGLVKHGGGSDGYQSSTVDTADYFKNKKVVIVAIPGAFTPTCMGSHLPDFIENAEKIRGKGADEIVCVSVNDPFVMTAFAEKMNAKQQISYLADGNGELMKKLEMELDLTALNIGTRLTRSTMIVKDGTIVQLNDEEGGASTDVSTAATILKQL